MDNIKYSNVKKQILPIRKVSRKVYGIRLAIISVLLVLSTNAYTQNCAVNAGVPQTVCENETLTLYGGFVGVSGGAFYWLQISGPSVIIDDPGAQVTTVTGISGPSTLGFRFYGLCGDGSIVYDEVTHTILPITHADAGPDQSSCPGANVITMAANTPAALESGSWSFVGNNRGITINDPSDPTTTLTLSETSYGTATMVWTISSASCSSADTVFVTNCGGEDPVDANRGGANTVTLSSCYTTTQSYRANASHAGSGACGQQGVWNIISGPGIPAVNNINDRRATFSALIEGTYVLEWCVSVHV
jgi:large repetitive protein